MSDKTPHQRFVEAMRDEIWPACLAGFGDEEKVLAAADAFADQECEGSRGCQQNSTHSAHRAALRAEIRGER